MAKEKKPRKLRKGMTVFAARYIPLAYLGIPAEAFLTVVEDRGDRVQVRHDRHPTSTPVWVYRSDINIPG